MEYRTVFEPAEARHTEKRSEFIGRIAHASDEKEAAAFIAQVRALERDARHNVFAYIASGGSSVRYSDDGEPQGTGGMPCLEVLKNAGLTDVVVTVTRYFGGILLGAPGLVRAYTKAAAEAVAAAKAVTMTECRLVVAGYDYSFHGRVSMLAESYGKIDNIEFSESVKLYCFVRNEDVDSYVSAITETTYGAARVNVSETSVFKAM